MINVSKEFLEEMFLEMKLVLQLKQQPQNK